jgi:hypothetical protein
VTGEPVRALLTRRSASVAAGVAAGAAERAVYNLLAFVLILVASLLIAAETHGLAVASTVAAVLLAIVGLAAFIERRRRRRQGGGRTNHNDSSHATPVMSPPAGPLRQAISGLWRERRGALPIIAALCLAQHALLIYEAYLLLGLLTGGTTLRTALVFEAVTKIVNTVGAIVPGRVGISEGGSALLADALGFGASHGLSLALMRRVRALIWTGVGLALLPVQEARARRRA